MAVLGAPFLFLCHLELNYLLVTWACSSGKWWVLPGVSAVFLLLLLIVAGISWTELSHSRGTRTEPDVPVPLGRHRLLAILGLMSASLFFLLVLAQGIATFIISPCPE
jgi:hypothetical protein